MDRTDPLAPYGASNRPTPRPLTPKEREFLGNALAIGVVGLALVGGIKLLGAALKAAR